jgi:hypothetical protein
MLLHSVPKPLFTCLPLALALVVAVVILGSQRKRQR